jgi:hypothetical protein
MKKTRSMSRTKEITDRPVLLTLPISIWFVILPHYRWHLAEYQDMSAFHFRYWDGSPSMFEDSWPPRLRDNWRSPLSASSQRRPESKCLRVKEYLDALLAINEPQTHRSDGIFS